MMRGFWGIVLLALVGTAPAQAENENRIGVIATILAAEKICNFFYQPDYIKHYLDAYVADNTGEKLEELDRRVSIQKMVSESMLNSERVAHCYMVERLAKHHKIMD